MSDIEKLTQLLLQQAELSAQRERDSAQREERLTQMVERLVADRQPPATVAADDASAATAARTSAAAPPVRLPAAATPAPHLSSSTSLRDFAVWREKLDGYMLLTGASALPVTAQRAALLSLLDEDWHRVLRYGLTIADDSPLSAVVDAMESHLRKQRSVLVDRRAFYARVQEQGENFEEFLCEVKELAAFCDFCTHCYDSRLRDKIVCGLRDEETVKRLLEDPGLDLKKTVDICHPAACRATSAICNSCGQRGHFAVVCAQVARESAAAPAERAAPERARPAVGQPSEPRICRVIRDVYVNGISTRPTPTVTVRLSTPAGVFTVPARADSGAEATVIGEDSLSSICVEPAQLEPCIGQPFSAVGKQPLTCVGSFRATLELGDRSTTAAVFVIRELTGLLLSWFDCVALGILPRDFPAQIRCYNKSTRRLSPLKIGSRVDLQDPATGRWNRIGVIVGVGQRRTYLVKTASGKVLWRNRRYLRPYRPLLTEPTPPVAPSAPRPPAAGAPQPPPPPPPPARTAVAAERAVRPAASAPAVCRSSPVRSPQVETAAAALPRRSRRQRRAPGRLRVQWGATSYAE
ncbi:hypothetical protein FJT64_025599 [Amphibalanus amphitrite]|uniref:CCHC-type domain-containing protein n=1 Tax=Amphibalanus amphitrite TaxID=1232801 RepID=A0A6A4WF90_AMPAM|nr:hypothetical protein FJT64_025599 [Amphibalanus amphitrite]